jgi:hypothetical protein
MDALGCKLCLITNLECRLRSTSTTWSNLVLVSTLQVQTCLIHLTALQSPHAAVMNLAVFLSRCPMTGGTGSIMQSTYEGIGLATGRPIVLIGRVLFVSSFVHKSGCVARFSGSWG